MTVPMTLLGAHAVSPRSSVPERAADARTGLAWQREMERAQRANWFQPSVIPSAEMPANGRGETQRTTELRPGKVESAPPGRFSTERPPNLLRLATPPTGLSSTGNATASRRETTAGPPIGDAPALSRTETGVSMQRALPAAPGAYHHGTFAAPLSVSAMPAPPLRTLADGHGISIHVEPSTRGAHVWVGAPVDTEIGAGALDALLRSLRRQLREEGLSLETLTVNGRTVWRAPEEPHHQSPKEE